jgi:uncharacterized protein (DUF302 family)
MNFAYTITSSKSFDDATRAIEQTVTANGFRVLHTHDVQQTFAEKGVARDAYKIVEVCNVKYANQALRADPLVGLMMPCKINVFTEQGVTKISLLLPSLLSEFFPHANLGALAQEVETILRAVVDSAK